MIAEINKGLIIAGHLDNLPNPETVTSVVLKAEGVTAQDMHKFVASLSRFSNLISLSVNYGNLQDMIAILTPALQPTLQELDLSGNYLMDKGATIIADTLSTLPNLVTLNLSGNDIEHAAPNLAEKLAGCPKLKSLILDDNFYSVESTTIFKTVATKLPHVTTFLVDHDDDGVLEKEFSSRNVDTSAEDFSNLHLDHQDSDNSDTQASGVVEQASSDDIT